jgi:hypothetical protein
MQFGGTDLLQVASDTAADAVLELTDELHKLAVR